MASCKGDQKKLCCLMNNLMGRDSPTSLPSSESDTQLALDFLGSFSQKFYGSERNLMAHQFMVIIL